MYTIFLALGSMVGSTTGGYIAGSQGWPYVSWVGVALSGFSFVCILLLVPETLFDRPATASVDPQGVHAETTEKGPTTAAHLETTSHPKSFTFGMSLVHFVYRGGLLKQLLRPYCGLLFPGVWLVMLLYGGLVGGIVTMSTVGPQIVSAPPYLWGINSGLINVGGVVGTIIGAAWTYVLADRRIQMKAKRHANGFSEPEDRLPAMFPSLVLATTGMWVYGFCADSTTPAAWVGLQFGMGMLSFALMQIPSIGFNYVS